LQVEQGRTVLEVALGQEIKITTLCYHKDLTPYGACRLCLVEIVAGGRPGLEASCVYKVTDGLKVKTDTERVKKARKIVFELLLARCPDAEKIKKLAREYGVTGTQIKLKKKENCRELHFVRFMCSCVCRNQPEKCPEFFRQRYKKNSANTF